MLLDSVSEGIYMMKMNVECKCSLTWRARLRPSVRLACIAFSIGCIWHLLCMLRMDGGGERGIGIWRKHGMERRREGGTRERGAALRMRMASLARSVSSVLFFRTFLSAPTTTAAASAGDKLVKAESAFEQVDEDILLCRYEAPSS